MSFQSKGCLIFLSALLLESSSLRLCCDSSCPLLWARPLSKTKSTSHYIVSKKADAYIDWTEGKVYAGAKAALQSIVPPISHNPYTFHEARAAAWRKAYERAEGRLFSLIYHIYLDSSMQSLYDAAQENPLLRKALAAIKTPFLIEKRRSTTKYAESMMSFPLKGEQGLYALLADSIISGTGSLAGRASSQGAVPISSIIIALEEFPDFQPTLLPRVFAHDGLLIYGPEYAKRSCFVEKGLVFYATSIAMARKAPYAGLRPYLAFAAGLGGKVPSDPILDKEDAYKILESPSGRFALRNCRVIFVVPSQYE